jgi:hypothetical protein
VRLDVAGRVPGPEVREQVLRLVESESRQIRPDVTIVDRLQIDAALSRVA